MVSICDPCLTHIHLAFMIVVYSCNIFTAVYFSQPADADIFICHCLVLIIQLNALM